MPAAAIWLADHTYWRGAEGAAMLGWAFSLLIGAFVVLILAALVLEFLGERGTAREPPIDPEPPVA